MFETFFPILFLLLFATVLAVALLLMSVLLGRKTRLGKKRDPYECGITPVGTTKDPVPVKFYLVAVLFILFDIEIVFLYPWAVISRNLGLFGFVEMLVFVLILLVGYFYILGRGALKWD
ncbi:MAG: NADH-quinone oxidoreductase subunit A [candidate division Zixibacteria bacterium]|nr:NADH-quinone oxidoreductase subunit A [candidate division Zixibacteria bacterium]MCK4607757.1 NADH-quinone oxidoreductase subunit A [candidate division Zixibacteria bacterium]